MGTKIATSTTYYSQSDDQFECTNQTIEIAFHYMTHRSSDADFIKFLSALKRYLNNSKNNIIGRSPNKIIYGTNLNDFFGVVSLKKNTRLWANT